MKRFRLLDLFCGAGGAAMGYHRAGFEVVGVDIKPQPRFPFEFHQADALTFPLDGYDVIHASPPCQRYSKASRCRPGLRHHYPDLIDMIRNRLDGKNYVIENVVGSPLVKPILLCGTMFGLQLYRHRLFETMPVMPLILHPTHHRRCSKAGHWKEGELMSVAGNCAPIALAREVMGITWMSREELAEAIPPAYTEWIGKQLIRRLEEMQVHETSNRQDQG